MCMAVYQTIPTKYMFVSDYICSAVIVCFFFYFFSLCSSIFIFHLVHILYRGYLFLLSFLVCKCHYAFFLFLFFISALRIDEYQYANSSAWRGVFILYYAEVAPASHTSLAPSTLHVISELNGEQSKMKNYTNTNALPY